ncbi:hypothetical protein FQN60_014921 [Etheostoma spectabile]|uniref:Uncharacterized protein n=1 Tax=Etheostoma spectabile TaxID=54343 RepID=A0A5J5CSG2_9PERO|nr:hypothetical protein FQN60_014921 [Etheostoma spectabile]
MLTFLWKFTFSNVLIISCCHNYVDNLDKPAIAKYFNTKGRYEEVNLHLIKDILAVNRSILQPPSANCQEIHLTAIIRHGTRYPTIKNVKEMKQLYNIVLHNASGQESWLHEIQTQWTMWYTEDMDDMTEAAFYLCAYEFAIKAVNSPWCQLFDEDDAKFTILTGVCCCFRNDVSHGGNPNIPAIAKYFSTKGRYEEVNPYLIEDILAVNRSILQPPSAQCREIHATAIIRHGTRYPTSKNVNKMKKLYELVKSRASGKESWLREIQTQWTMWYSEDMDGRLVQKGVNDHKHLAIRLFVQEVENNPSALSEVDKFKEGPEMRRFAIKTVNSPWCQLFDEVDAQVLEYANDLKQFWKRAFGYDINSKSSCILFHDVSGQQVTEAVTVQVGHAETLLPLLTLLGFFKDSDALTSTNYDTQTQRSFRTSHMLPYAANLVLVLYDCGGGDLRLQPLLNEKPVTFPGLTDQQASMPLYQDVKDHYRELLQGCDFETECQLFKSPA